MYRNPAASARSLPGVRMVTEMDLGDVCPSMSNCISRGSSTETKSGRRMDSPPFSRVISEGEMLNLSFMGLRPRQCGAN